MNLFMIKVSLKSADGWGLYVVGRSDQYLSAYLYFAPGESATVHAGSLQQVLDFVTPKHPALANSLQAALAAGGTPASPEPTL